MIIKTSSLGDIIHTLPALTDAMHAIPGIQFDWVIEEGFQIIPSYHPAVDRVIPITLRRWKKNKKWLSALGALKKFKIILNQKNYDLVIDAQGLLKSALITRFVKAPSAGYQKNSIREKWASLFYHENYEVSLQQHAVERIRDLFSQALYYPRPESMANYGIDKKKWLHPQEKAYILFFHGTTWSSKHWPEHYWKQLLQLLNQRQWRVKLSWGNEQEYARSERIASSGDADILPNLDIEHLMPVIANASAVIAVDTGLCHLAAALTIPTIALFGPTDPEKTGIMGQNQINLTARFPCSPCLKRTCQYPEETKDKPACFMTLPPQRVFQQLIEMNVRP